MTSPNRSTTGDANFSPASAARQPLRSERVLRETKPSFITTEFWAMLLGIVALIATYNWADNPDLTLWRTCLLCTTIASAYIVSRGWAKSGSHDDRVDRDYNRTEYTQG